jgi:hypothetical protein
MNGIYQGDECIAGHPSTDAFPVFDAKLIIACANTGTIFNKDCRPEVCQIAAVNNI